MAIDRRGVPHTADGHESLRDTRTRALDPAGADGTIGRVALRDDGVPEFIR